MIMKVIVMTLALLLQGAPTEGADLCKGKPSAAALQRYLDGRADFRLPECLRAWPVSEGTGGVAIVAPRSLSGGSEGLLVWRSGDRWRVAEWPQGSTPYRVAGKELIAGHWQGGSGGYGQIQLYRLDNKLQLVWESPVYEKFRVDALSDTYLLTGHRPEGTWEEPHAIMANCCLPSDGQILWEREGERFVPKASRTIPNPYRAVSLFVGALRKGDRQTAMQWAWSPIDIDPAGLSPDRWTEVLETEWPIEDAERRHWDAIPEALRGPAPSQTRMDWPSGTHNIITERRNGQWKVSAVEPSPRAP